MIVSTISHGYHMTTHTQARLHTVMQQYQELASTCSEVARERDKARAEVQLLREELHRYASVYNVCVCVCVTYQLTSYHIHTNPHTHAHTPTNTPKPHPSLFFAGMSQKQTTSTSSLVTNPVGSMKTHPDHVTQMTHPLPAATHRYID